MTQILIELPLTTEHKTQAMNIIMETIQKVSTKENISLSDNDIRKIKNLALDQVNINVAHKNNLKNMWVFDTETKYPITIEVKNVKKFNANVNEAIYEVKPNGDLSADATKAGLPREVFERICIENLMQDFETAAFYGTASYGDDRYVE